MVGVTPGERISYQRTPTPEPALTLWFATSDSWLPKLRYARRNMRRSARESSNCGVPACGMHVPPLQAAVYVATVSVIGPVSVVFAGVVQSTWNFHKARSLLLTPSAST